MKRREQKELDDARVYCATQMLNQVGIEWDEACDSVEILERRLRNENSNHLAVVEGLYAEAYRYEDM